MRRVVVAVLACMAGLVALAPVAGADPARPGNFRSWVDRITPATDAISARVVGGDGFLDLKVQPGHTVDVPGYTGEPWLRINAQGRVQENQASSATYLNASRYGNASNTAIPSWVTIKRATDDPIWKTVGHNGHYVWHDHRIHYMTPQIAPTVIPGTNRVVISDRSDGRWYIDLKVDGHPTQILGELHIYPAPSPALPWAVAAVLFVALSVIGLTLRGVATRLAAALLVVMAALGLWAGFAELSVIPTLAGGNPIWVALPAVCIVAGLGALALRGSASRSIAILAGAAALGVWAVLRVPAFDKAVPLGDLNPTLTRLIAAGALGIAAGSIVAAIGSGGLAMHLPDLDADDEDDEDSGDSGALHPASTDVTTTSGNGSDRLES